MTLNGKSFKKIAFEPIEIVNHEETEKNQICIERRSVDTFKQLVASINNKSKRN